MKKIGFIGLGVMGSAMVVNLARTFEVRVFNRTKRSELERLAEIDNITLCDDVVDAVTEADFVGLCVGGPDDVREVLFDKGVASRCRPNTLVIDFSTIGSAAAIEIADKLNIMGLRMIDAPVSGGDIGARNGTLTVMVGGDETDFAAAEPVLHAVGEKIFHVGPHGAGQTVKLINNQLAAAKTIATADAIAMAEQLGISAEMMVKVTSTGAAGSWSLSNLGPRIINRNFTAGFAARHMLKDLRLAAEMMGDKFSAYPSLKLALDLFEQVESRYAKESLATQGVYKCIVNKD